MSRYLSCAPSQVHSFAKSPFLPDNMVALILPRPSCGHALKPSRIALSASTSSSSSMAPYSSRQGLKCVSPLPLILPLSRWNPVRASLWACSGRRCGRGTRRPYVPRSNTKGIFAGSGNACRVPTSRTPSSPSPDASRRTYRCCTSARRLTTSPSIVACRLASSRAWESPSGLLTSLPREAMAEGGRGRHYSTAGTRCTPSTGGNIWAWAIC